MKRWIQKAAVLLIVLLLAGIMPAWAAGGVELNGTQGKELNLDPYDAMIDFSNVRNSAVFHWPSQGNVLVYGGATYTPTLKEMMLKLDGMVIPANLVVDFYYKCPVTNSATYPYGYTFLAQYDTRDGNADTVNGQELLYELDRAFGTNLASAGTTHGVPFQGMTDVRATDYYADAVAWALEEGVTGGTSATTFSPAAAVTRGQAVTFLWRAAGSPEPAGFASPFTDVSSSDYFYKPVLWAVEKGITAGIGANQFGPDVPLAYDQIFTFLCKAAGESAPGSDWSQAAVNWASRSGLTDGLQFSAKAVCPRSDVVYCIWKQCSDGVDTGSTEEGTAGSDVVSLTDLEAAKAAIVNGFVEGNTHIDVAPYHIESSQLLAAAREIADIDGKNPYRISVVSCLEPEGRQAKTIGVIYYISDGTDTPASQEAVQKAEEIVADVVTADMSDYDIAKALHDYLVLHCAYDYDNYRNHTIPAASYTANGALLDGVAVCSGYAKAYEALLTAAGIPCETISGYANGSHAWNLVQIDGAWYHVDTTWDDPAPDKQGYVRYDYFLKSDAYMRSHSHTKWNGTTIACTSTKYDNVSLPDTQEQEQQKEQQKFAAIQQICEDFIAALPYQTQAEREGATYEQLMSARYAYVTLDSSYDNLTLQEAYQAMADDLRAKYPDLSISYDREHHGYKIYRKDLVAAAQAIQQEQKEQQAQQQEQEDSLVQQAQAELEQALAQLLPSMNQETTTVSLPGYSDQVIQSICKAIQQEKVRVGSYAYDTDYYVRAQSGGVEVVNQKWAEEEIQSYLDQIDAAIDDGEFEVTLSLKQYPDQDDNAAYAFQAYVRARNAGHVTPGGREAGVDYEFLSGGHNETKNTFSIQIQYLNPQTLTVEECVAQIQAAIRSGKDTVQFQFQPNDRGDNPAKDAVEQMTQKGYGFDDYVYGEDYSLHVTQNYSTGICTVQILYQTGE